MDFFQAKIGWERPWKRENKKNIPMGSWTTLNRKFQKIAKIFKKLEITFIASFQVKIGWERSRKRENKKKIVSMSSYPTRNRKFLKNRKKIQKLKKKNIMASFKPRQDGKGREREKKKNHSDEFLLDLK